MLELVGRKPTDFTQELGDRICDRLLDGESLRRICMDPMMPKRVTVLKWLNLEVEFAAQYAKAKELQVEALVDEILDIADDGSNDFMETQRGDVVYNGDAVQRSRLRIESRRWVAAKLKPKKYGDAMQLVGKDGGDLVPNQIVHVFALPENNRDLPTLPSPSADKDDAE
jgi:hypothetical protein